MPSLNPDHVKAVIEAINNGPFLKHLSMTVKDLDMGSCLVELEIGEEHLNPFGGLHGGVYAAAIDTAAYWAVYCEVDENVGMISIDLKVDYLAAFRTGRLITKGRSIKIGKTICLAEAGVFDENDKWLAHGISKMMVTKRMQTMKNVTDFLNELNLPPKFI